MATPYKFKNIQTLLGHIFYYFLRDSLCLSAVAYVAGAEGGTGEIGKEKGRAEEKERAPPPSSPSFFSPDFPNPFMRLLCRLVHSLLSATWSVVTRFALVNPQHLDYILSHLRSTKQLFTVACRCPVKLSK